MLKYLRYFIDPALRKSMIIAWVIAIVVTAAVIIVTGNIYSASQAKSLLEAVQKASLFYCSAIITASATIIALMLTLLSLTINKMDEPQKEIFIRLNAITHLCVVAFIEAVILLLIISFPTQKFQHMEDAWFHYGYYIITIWNGMLAAHMIATILVLKDITKNVIGYLSPDYDDEGNRKDGKE